jgi:hypothetical protein
MWSYHYTRSQEGWGIVVVVVLVREGIGWIGYTITQSHNYKKSIIIIKTEGAG